MKTTITKYVIAGLAVISGIVSWMTVDWAINIPNSSHWALPTICFTIFFITIALSVILIKKRYIILLILAASFFASLFFSFSLWHVLMLLLCFLLAGVAAERIAADLRLNIKFNISRSVRTGRSLMILALSIAIASQYYAEIRNNNQIEIIPEFEMGDAINRILPMMFPDLKNNLEDDLTVDDFIKEVSEQNIGNFIGDSSTIDLPGGSVALSNDQMEQIVQNSQDRIIEEERKNLSKMAGMTLTGDEKISDVFSEMINQKINTFFAPSLQPGSQPILPWLASFILFLTVASLGSLLGSLVGYFIALLFWIMRKIGLVSVSRVQVEMEVID